MGYHIAVTVCCMQHARHSRFIENCRIYRLYTRYLPTVCVKVRYEVRQSNTIFTARTYISTSIPPTIQHISSSREQLPPKSLMPAALPPVLGSSLEQKARPSSSSHACRPSLSTGRPILPPFDCTARPQIPITTQTQRRSGGEADERWAAGWPCRARGARQDRPEHPMPGKLRVLPPP